MIQAGSYIVKVSDAEGGAFRIEVTPLNDATAPQVEAPAARTHPDIFTTEEARAYLKLTKDSFARNRREHGIKPKRLGGGSFYSREQLDALRVKIWGMDLPQRRK